MDINQIKDTFTKYIYNFDMEDPSIKRKFSHSFRVMQLSIDIANFANFNERDIEIASIVGLLHDYARFYQWTKYKTYRDTHSIDHGDKAIEFLFDDNEIKNYSLNIRDYDEIYDGIKNHNKYSVPENLSEHNKKMLEVVRDADKLDIFYLYSINEVDFNEDNSDISLNIVNQFNDKKPIKHTKEMNNNDWIIATICMVYDLNFKYSYKLLKEKDYINKMFEYIKDKEKFKIYFEEIGKYIESMVK